MPCQSICILNHRSDILVGMLKKEKKRTADLEMSVKQGGGRIPDGTAVAPEGIRRSTSQPLSDDSESELSNLRSASRTRVKDRPSSDTTEVYTSNSCVKIVFVFVFFLLSHSYGMCDWSNPGPLSVTQFYALYVV